MPFCDTGSARSGEGPAGKWSRLCLRHAEFKGTVVKLGRGSVSHNSQREPKRQSTWVRHLEGEELGKAAGVPEGGLAWDTGPRITLLSK